MKQILKLFVLCVVFLVAGSGSALAQEEEDAITVTSFKELPEDLTARVIAPKKDFNGKLAAIVKLVTPEKGFVVDNGVLGVVSTKEEVGELWIYLPEGTKKITLKHPTLGVLRNYFFSQSLQEATVYEMRIKTSAQPVPAPATVEQNNNTSTQYFVLNYTPADIEVELYIDETIYMPGSGGSISTKLSSGQHTYKLLASKHITKTGVFEILDEKVTLDLALEEATSKVEFTSVPENGADVYLNGQKIGTTPFTYSDLDYGNYTVTVKHPYFLPTTYDIDLTTAQGVVNADIPLNANSAYITIVSPAGTELTINDQNANLFGANGRYRLISGNYTIKAQREGCEPSVAEVQVVAGQNQIVPLKEPVRAYGSLDISTGNISGASIYIDGVKNTATTPDIISNLPAGDHIITLVKDGYKSVDVTVTIAANETTTQDVVLQGGYGIASSQSAYSAGSSAQSSEVIPSRSRSRGPRTGFLFGFEFSSQKYDYSGVNYPVTQYGGKIGYVFSESGIYAKALFAPTSSTENVSAGRNSFLLGYSIAPSRFLMFNVGAGMGQILVDYYGTKVVNRISYELEAGLSIHLGVLYLSYSVATFEFKDIESRFGVGFIF